jgi:hypothetical protein
LASNQFTLAAGTYFVTAWAFIESQGGRYKLRIRNITDGSTALVGMVTWVGGANGGPGNPVSGRFTLAGTKTLELQYYVQAGAATDGLGVSYAATGEVETYATLTIYKET